MASSEEGGQTFRGLADVFAALAPDVAARFAPEMLATCDDCAMKPRPGIPEFGYTFSASARCCTYHPELPAYAVGRALRRGGLGAARIRARIRRPDGVEADGIHAWADYRRRYQDDSIPFGGDESMTCPFWSAEAPEGRGCTIHLDRESVCRTWHCRIEGGGRGHATWVALKTLLTCIEDTLVSECLATETPPVAGDPPESWERWYLWCADRVDELAQPENVERLRGDRLSGLIAQLHRAADERDQPMPAVLIPTIGDWRVHEAGVTLSSWSTYDAYEAPPWIFLLLSRMDGRTPWRRAKAETEAELRQPVGDDLILSMFRRSLLGPPEYLDAQPGMTIVVKPEL
jgi:Fe-S-cluster containining protein